MKKLFILLLLTGLIFVACNKESEDLKQSEDNSKVYTLEELMSDDFEYNDGKITVEGLCVHVCAHSGKKMFIVGKDPENKLQIFTSENLSSFDKNFEGSNLRVSGTLEEEKIDMKYIQEWEEELAKENSESPETCAFEDSMKKIDAFKSRISKSKKGYVSNYSMTGIEVKQI